jgi:hypothetical protein
MRTLAFLLLTALFSTTGSPQTSDSLAPASPVAGTRVSLRPPVGFTLSHQFSGFELERLGSSIMVTEFPGPFTEVSAGFSNPSELVKRGMSLLNNEDVKVSEQTGVLFKVSQNVSGKDFLKWIVIFGDEKESVVVVAAFPKEQESQLSEKMRASVLTSSWDRTKTVSLTEGLNFSVSEMGDLKLAKRFANSLLFTKGAVFPSKEPDDPIFIIAQPVAKSETRDLEQFAKARVFETASVSGVEIEQSTKVIVDKLNGYEIVAKANDVESGEPMVIYQVILFEPQGYYIMQGLISTKQRQSFLPLFKQMALSFKRKK